MFIHPEIQKREVFFTNTDSKGFDHMTWKTKRKGCTAYDGNGKRTGEKNWFPVFLDERELEINGKELSLARKEFRVEHCEV